MNWKWEVTNRTSKALAQLSVDLALGDRSFPWVDALHPQRTGTGWGWPTFWVGLVGLHLSLVWCVQAVSFLDGLWEWWTQLPKRWQHRPGDWNQSGRVSVLHLLEGYGAWEKVGDGVENQIRVQILALSLTDYVNMGKILLTLLASRVNCKMCLLGPCEENQ